MAATGTTSEMKGYLQLKNNKRFLQSPWQQFYFVLTKNTLHMYSAERDSSSSALQDLRGCLGADQMVNVVLNEKDAGNKTSARIEITTRRQQTLTLKASTFAELESWHSALLASIKNLTFKTPSSETCLYRLNAASEDSPDSMPRRSVSLTALDDPALAYPDPGDSLTAASAHTATMGRRSKRRPALPISSDNMRNLHERHRETRGMDKATLVVPKEDAARSLSTSPKPSARKVAESPPATARPSESTSRTSTTVTSIATEIVNQVKRISLGKRKSQKKQEDQERKQDSAKPSSPGAAKSEEYNQSAPSLSSAGRNWKSIDQQKPALDSDRAELTAKLVKWKASAEAEATPFHASKQRTDDRRGPRLPEKSAHFRLLQLQRLLDGSIRPKEKKDWNERDVRRAMDAARVKVRAINRAKSMVAEDLRKLYDHPRNLEKAASLKG